MLQLDFADRPVRVPGNVRLDHHAELVHEVDRRGIVVVERDRNHNSALFYSNKVVNW
jgi:hypothetical protein